MANVVKISGTVVEVRETNRDRISIKFAGDIAGKTDIKKPCVINMDNALEHAVEAKIGTAGMLEGTFLLGCKKNNLSVEIHKDLLPEMIQGFITKRKGGTRVIPIEEKIQEAANKLTEQRLIVLLNPKSGRGPLSEQNLKGTRIDVVVHQE